MKFWSRIGRPGRFLSMLATTAAVIYTTARHPQFFLNACAAIGVVAALLVLWYLAGGDE